MSEATKKVGCLISEVTEALGLEDTFVIHCIKAHWISPARREEPLQHTFLDEEDLARIRLIHDLRAHFGVNDEGITIALHLLDQLYSLRAQIRKERRSD